MMFRFQLNLSDEDESYYPFTDYEDWLSFRKMFDEIQSVMAEKSKIEQIIKKSEEDIKAILFPVAEIK